MSKCRKCGDLMTWRAQRKQFGRCIKAGMTASEVKAIMPQCQFCTTKFFESIITAQNATERDGSLKGPQPMRYVSRGRRKRRKELLAKGLAK